MFRPEAASLENPAVPREAGMGPSAAATKDRTCQSKPDNQWQDQNYSLFSSLAVAVNSDKKYVQPQPELMVCLHFIFEQFLAPLVNLEKTISNLQTDYLKRVVATHKSRNKEPCGLCVEAAQTSEYQIQLLAQNLKIELFQLYGQFSRLLFPQRYHGSLDHTCLHQINTPFVLESDCQCWCVQASWVNPLQLYLWGAHIKSVVNKPGLAAVKSEPARHPEDPQSEEVEGEAAPRPSGSKRPAEEPSPEFSPLAKRSRWSRDPDPDSDSS